MCSDVTQPQARLVKYTHMYVMNYTCTLDSNNIHSHVPRCHNGTKARRLGYTHMYVMNFHTSYIPYTRSDVALARETPLLLNGLHRPSWKITRSLLPFQQQPDRRHMYVCKEEYGRTLRKSLCHMHSLIVGCTLQPKY